jgi:hypothetical protein
MNLSPCEEPELLVLLPRYAEEQNVRMKRDAECRAMALLEDAGVSAAAGDPHAYQQLLVGSVSHKVLPPEYAELSLQGWGQHPTAHSAHAI